MGDSADIIQVLERVFDEGRHEDNHADMKQKLEEAIAAVFKANSMRNARPRNPKKPVDQWKSTRVPGKRPLNPTAEIVPENQVHSVCNKITESNYKKLQPMLIKFAEFDADMVVSTVLKCIVKSGSFLPLYVKILADIRKRHTRIVDVYLANMCDTFLDGSEFLLEDDTESDDYDKFCAYVAEKKRRLARFKFLSLVGKSESLSTALPDMVQSLGEKDSSLSKVMVIEMLGIYYTGCRTVKKQDVHAFETYTKQSREHGIGPNARFKLMDLLSTIRMIKSV
jgi:hypothetical protein